MLELYEAKVSVEEANLKFLRSLPSIWHVVATMIRGQSGLDSMDFDDLYNNLKVYEHEMNGQTSSKSHSIAFLSSEKRGSTSTKSTASPTQSTVAQSTVSHSTPTFSQQPTPTHSLHSDKVVCSFFHYKYLRVCY